MQLRNNITALTVYPITYAIGTCINLTVRYIPYNYFFDFRDNVTFIDTVYVGKVYAPVHGYDAEDACTVRKPGNVTMYMVPDKNHIHTHLSYVYTLCIYTGTRDYTPYPKRYVQT